jgi:glycosyltransferase involved in cell wall biosynthesis
MRFGSIDPERLNILCVSHMPASPPQFGAQARTHGLMTQLAQRHDLTAVMLVDPTFDIEECRRAMQAYCPDVVLVPNPYGRDGLGKRLLQLRSLASARSYERLRATVPALPAALDRVLRSRPFDVVNLEFPFLGHCNLRQACPGHGIPSIVVDSHNIEHDLNRQFVGVGGGTFRRLYAEANWRKLRREELAAYREADGVYLCSMADEQRLLAQVPDVRTAVIPNAADVDFYQPRPTDPPPDGRTVTYFGLLSTIPNADAVKHFADSIWSRLAATRPEARWKIIGGGAPASMQALADPRVELTGFVSDLRPHLAEAAVVVVPMRLGGGTRLKIVEAMAMGKPIVSTTLGAEGIEAVPGRDLLIADEPAAFADAVTRLLDDRPLCARLGDAARRLAVERYSWTAAAQRLEGFVRSVGPTRASQPRPR